MLSSAQLSAIEHIKQRSSGPALDDPKVRVTINFHPDRYINGQFILNGIAKDGAYVSRFVVGGWTEFTDGMRAQWESRLFGQAYDTVSSEERPIYGALSFGSKSGGGAPRFGSSYFRLHPSCLKRSTFCYPDSGYDPTYFGVAEACDVELMSAAYSNDILENYIEAQVHGAIVVERDIEALVLDPSYKGTEVELAARKLACPIEFHSGFRLSIEDLKKHPEYRGQHIADWGCKLAVDGWLDPAIIGAAVNSGNYEKQVLKSLWHCIARYGDRSM